MIRSSPSLVRPRGGLSPAPRRTWLSRVNWGTPAWLCFAAALALTLMGLAAIGTTRPDLVPKQATLLVVGLLAAAVVIVPSHRLLQWISWPMLVLVIGLLVFLLIPSVPDFVVRPRNGARRWINLVVTDFQP
ncbi:MAG: hypothetical protein HOJ54_10610, partial [Phycisphaerae bacterium]|nr:hypothetical protein [Phycisphaerae bacterium]